MTEKPIDDVYVDIDIPSLGSMKLKVLDSQFLLQGILFFRPIIRGFLVLLLMIFYWENIMGLIRQAMPIKPTGPSETSSITISDKSTVKFGDGSSRTVTKNTTRSERRSRW